jgi:hypothetical protein
LGTHLHILEPITGLISLQITIPDNPIRLILLSGGRHVLIGFSSGCLAMVGLDEGAIAWQMSLSLDGLPLVPIALAEREGNVLIGSPDGRILRAKLG